MADAEPSREHGLLLSSLSPDLELGSLLWGQG